jgi:flagellar protein FlbD
VIKVTRLNHVPLVLNTDLIEYMEATPDTVITLSTGQKIVVRETAEEVVSRVIEFRRQILSGMSACPLQASSAAGVRISSGEGGDGE